jgi:hypothetical protein
MGYCLVDGSEFSVQTLEEVFLANFSLGGTTMKHLAKIARKLDPI